MLELFPIPPVSSRASWLSAARVRRARRALRDSARRLLRADPPRGGPGPTRAAGRRSRVLRDEGVPERRAPPTSPRGRDRRRRRVRRRARVRSRSRSRATSSSCTGTTRTSSVSRRGREGASPRRPGRADEAELAIAAGVEHVLVRVTLGVDADTHEAIVTGHHGSKFGLPPAQARALVADALGRGLDVRSGSTSTSARSSRTSPRRRRSAVSPSSRRRAATLSAGRHESSTSEVVSGFIIPRRTSPRRPRLRPPQRRPRARRSSQRVCPGPLSGSSPDGVSSAAPASRSTASVP